MFSFAQWLTQQSDFRTVPINQGNLPQGVTLFPGQQNYILELVGGPAGVPTLVGTIGPVTRGQLERLRDYLMVNFPPPQAQAAGQANQGGAGTPAP